MMRPHRTIPDGNAFFPLHIADKRGIDAAGLAVLYADGAHGVEPERVEGTDVHVGKVSGLIRVCVDASYAAEAVDVAHKPHLLHMDGVVVSNAHILYLTHAGDIDEHLAVDQRSEMHQRITNFIRKELVRGHLGFVEPEHFV